jgi:hypothetical protein
VTPVFYNFKEPKIYLPFPYLPNYNITCHNNTYAICPPENEMKKLIG